MIGLGNSTYKMVIYVYDVSKDFLYPANATDPQYLETCRRFFEYTHRN